MPKGVNPKTTAFIVTSVIDFGLRPLSYSDTRSAYSPDERAEQTKRTIVSIRERVPDARIILVEAGRSAVLPFGLDRLADQYIFLGNNFLVRHACDSRYKGLGEAVMLMCAAGRLVESDRYFKISGRYCLNDSFDLAQWDRGGFVFRRYGDAVSTRLYKFDRDNMGQWRKALCLSIPGLLSGKSIEDALPKFLPKHAMTFLDKLGVEGHVGPDRTFLGE